MLGLTAAGSPPVLTIKSLFSGEEISTQRRKVARAQSGRLRCGVFLSGVIFTALFFRSGFLRFLRPRRNGSAQPKQATQGAESGTRPPFASLRLCVFALRDLGCGFGAGHWGLAGG